MAPDEKYAEVQDHWNREGVLQRIDAALREAGHDPENITTETLFSFDQVHGGGLATTRAHAEKVGFTPAMEVLDIGCGIGGPARFLAETYGCRVSGIDLIEEWAAAGQVLTERCGLAGQVDIRQGDALNLPFEDNRFDVVWCQNLTMNINDKSAFLANVHRVLKAGGKFTYAEYCRGKEGDFHYPVSWADSPEINFVITNEEMNELLKAGGFRVTECWDYSETMLANRKQPNKGDAKQQAGAAGVLVVIGGNADEVAVRQRQVMRNMEEGLLIYQIVVAERV